MRPKLICVKCSMNEKKNPTCADVGLVAVEDEFFGDDDSEFEVWMCPQCKHKIWARIDLPTKGK